MYQFWIYWGTKKDRLLTLYETILPIQNSSVWGNSKCPTDINSAFLVKIVGGFIWQDDIKAFE